MPIYISRYAHASKNIKEEKETMDAYLRYVGGVDSSVGQVGIQWINEVVGGGIVSLVYSCRMLRRIRRRHA